MQTRFETRLGDTDYGCNSRGEGLFYWHERDGWRQLEGTCDTPRFINQRQFRRYVKTRYAERV